MRARPLQISFRKRPPPTPLPPSSPLLPSPLSAPGLGRTKRLKQCNRTKRRKRRRHLSSFARVGKRTRGREGGEFVECGRGGRACRRSSFVVMPGKASVFGTNFSFKHIYVQISATDLTQTTKSAFISCLFLPSLLPRKPSIARVMLQHAARNNPLSSPLLSSPLLSSCLKPPFLPFPSTFLLRPPAPVRRSASIEAHRGFAHTLRGRRISTVSYNTQERRV